MPTDTLAKMLEGIDPKWLPLVQILTDKKGNREVWIEGHGYAQIEPHPLEVAAIGWSLLTSMARAGHDPMLDDSDVVGKPCCCSVLIEDGERDYLFGATWLEAVASAARACGAGGG